MSIASIGQKILIACKYVTIAMLLAMWCGFTGLIGIGVGLIISGGDYSTHYPAAIIGALVGLVFIIGLTQMDTKEKKTGEES
jgi:hypothetical protein